MNIVVPVYAGLAQTEACLESVFANRETDDTVTIVNDASPDHELRQLCERYAREVNVIYLAHPHNQGFVVSVNAGMAATPDMDVVLLNSDTVVPAGWSSRLRACAAHHPKAATITPFTNNGTLCSYPHPLTSSPLPKGLDLEALDRLVAVANSGESVEIPTAVGFCMYIRRAALDEVGRFDEEAFGRGYGEENEWCCRASEAGWHHRLAADIFVFHEGNVSFGDDATPLQTAALSVLRERYPDYEQQIADFIARDPIRDFRDRIDRARSVVAGQSTVLWEESHTRQRNAETQLRTLEIQHAEMLADRKQLAEAFASFRAESASRQQQFEETLSNLEREQARLVAELSEAHRIYGDQIAAYDTRIGEYDKRCQQYDALLASVRTDYAMVLEQVKALEAENTVLQRARTKWQRRLRRVLRPFGGNDDTA